jgi:hypothetical protein
MTTRPPTEKELQRFAMILDYYERNGIDPTIAEQRKMFRLANGTVQALRQTLLRKGLLKKVGTRYIPVSRSQTRLKLADDTYDIQRAISGLGLARAQQKVHRVLKRFRQGRTP